MPTHRSTAQWWKRACATASWRRNVFVVDSSEEKITAEGVIDLTDEEYDLRLVAHSKRPSIVALRGPIRIGGSFKHPKVRPEVAPLALRVGAAVALGTLLTPVASLLALVDPGGAKDSNCAALVDQARTRCRQDPGRASQAGGSAAQLRCQGNAGSESPRYAVVSRMLLSIKLPTTKP